MRLADPAGRGEKIAENCSRKPPARLFFQDMSPLPLTPLPAIGGRLALFALLLLLSFLPPSSLAADTPGIPLIDVTDLYHPYQDPGDNFDLVAAYGFPEIDLRAVILDATQSIRAGKIDPGFIPVIQLNYIFDRNVPYGVSPFRKMQSPADKLLDVPAFQQSGIQLILDTLRRSKQKVHIVSFGSARTIAAAYNREPALFSKKVARIHLSAGGAPKGALEWNVLLDPNAIVCLLRSHLPIDIYPCSSPVNIPNPKVDTCGSYVLGKHNTYWLLPDLGFIASMDPHLRRYLAYSFTRASRSDFLGAIDDPATDAAIPTFTSRRHHVWETSVWQGITGRKLVSRDNAGYRLLPDANPGDKVITESLRPCSVQVEDNGSYRWDFNHPSKNFRIYERQDPQADQKALREALPALYQSFKPKTR